MFGIDDAIGAGLKIGSQILDRVIPDPQAAALAKLELLKLQTSGDLAELSSVVELSKAQTEVNKEEAASGSIFVGGWRPFIGWVCGFGLAFQFLLGPFLTWGAAFTTHPVVFPSLDNGTLLALVSGMLGIAGMRTYEKSTGVTNIEPSRAGQATPG